jgi:hypothetical protein
MLTGPRNWARWWSPDVENTVVNAAAHNQLELASGQLLDQQAAAIAAEAEPPDAADWGVSLPKEVDSWKGCGSEKDKERAVGRQLARGSPKRLKGVETENSKLEEVIHHRIQQVIMKANNVHWWTQYIEVVDTIWLLRKA